MATLAPASSEFVDALRRGLEAYDAGEVERASLLFDEALEIEPDNVWGLLWKGATASTVGEAKMWLEQAIAIDAHNEHARAGLKWANEQLSGGTDDTLSLIPVAENDAEMMEDEGLSSDGTDSRDEHVVDDLSWLEKDDEASVEELAAFNALFEQSESESTGDDDRVDMTAQVDDAAEADEEVSGYDNLQTMTSERSSSDDAGLPDWMEADAPPTVTEDLPEDVAMSGTVAPTATAAETTEAEETLEPGEAQAVAEFPDWLTTSDELAPADFLEDTSTVESGSDEFAPQETLPDWLTAEDEPAFADGGTTGFEDDRSDSEAVADVTEADLSQPADLPDWLVDDVPSSAAVTELPDWLTMEETPPAAEDGASQDEPQPDALPDWLTGDTVGEAEPAAPASTELPDWLTGDDTAAAENVPVADADLPDWLTGAAGTPATAEADLPDWLTGTAEPASPTADLPDWLTGAASAPAAEAIGELPSWLLGDDSAPFQATRGQGSLAPSDEVVEAYQAGLWAYEEDRLDDATRAFQRVIRLDPAHVEAHNYLGSVFYLNGRQDDAITALRRALQLDPSHSESYLNLGLVYKETGRNSQALQMFNRYLDLAPSDDTTTDYVRELIGELGG